MGVSEKSVSWTLRFVTKVLQENGRRSDVTFLVQTFWTPPYVLVRVISFTLFGIPLHGSLVVLFFSEARAVPILCHHKSVRGTESERRGRGRRKTTQIVVDVQYKE